MQNIFALKFRTFFRPCMIYVPKQPKKSGTGKRDLFRLTVMFWHISLKYLFSLSEVIVAFEIDTNKFSLANQRDQSFPTVEIFTPIRYLKM